VLIRALTLIENLKLSGYFHHDFFFVTIKLIEGQFNNFININIILKNKCYVHYMRHCMNCLCAIQNVSKEALDDQTVTFEMIFESSRQLLHP
jgi:hypothetical protein